MARLLFFVLLMLAVPLASADAATPAACTVRPDPAVKRAAVTLNPATSWQPRGGLLLVDIPVSGDDYPWRSLIACFGWEEAAEPTHTGAVLLRPSDEVKVAHLGIEVPKLPSAVSLLQRVWKFDQSMGLGLVPSATVRLIGTDAAGRVVLDESFKMGVTSMWLAMAVMLAALAVGVLLIALLRVRGAQSFMLSAIVTADGRAGLAQAQILLWTFVICGANAYVMALTGNLVNITDGALILLGIAAATTVGAAVQANPQSQKAQAAGPKLRPRWADLVMALDGSGKIDVMRLQMLFFTLVTAAFVAVKTLSTCEIPNVPAGYTTLMGISNGAYISARYAAR